MGIVRLYLAISVLHQHAPFWPAVRWMPGYTAVCAFFIISGFYMALVLDTKYQAAPLRFYANRALRLAPAYWAVLLLGVIANEMGWLAQSACCNDIDNILQPSRAMSASERAVGLLSNLTLLPAAIYSNATLFARANWPWASLMFGQMYTVGLELVFYALAPLLVLLRGWRLAAALGVALAVHFTPLLLGLEPRPWQYEFFPAVLVFFLLGIASYRLHQWLAGAPLPAALGWAAVPLIFLSPYVAGGNSAVFTNTLDTWALYVGLALLIPFLFAASKDARFDRIVGDMSYPAYTVHFLVIAWALNLGIDDRATRSQIILAVTLALSTTLLFGVEWTFNGLRKRIAANRGNGQALRGARSPLKALADPGPRPFSPAAPSAAPPAPAAPRANSTPSLGISAACFRRDRT